ncbi:hypothetical protein O181_067361 [Austropuccinia psidii MF-1]|uniref:Uncharacterized protein n=1 Tax=Austropuccinia psidii MF-1 TaxID=1389203 RepID=A0A9Q3EZG2_9BASI|nr:hypothetical protein [Austropuccinia psidii MF-1]
MGFGAKIGSGGSNCGLGPTWPWGLVGFPVLPIGLGQKGPNWPMDRRGHRGRGPEPPRKQKDTPRPKNKDKDLGVGDMEELAREAKDGRIWPEAIKGQGRVIWPKCHSTPEVDKFAIKIWCGQLAPTWSQVGIATTPIEEGHSLCL